MENNIKLLKKCLFSLFFALCLLQSIKVGAVGFSFGEPISEEICYTLSGIMLYKMPVTIYQTYDGNRV